MGKCGSSCPASQASRANVKLRRRKQFGVLQSTEESKRIMRFHVRVVPFVLASSLLFGLVGLASAQPPAAKDAAKAPAAKDAGKKDSAKNAAKDTAAKDAAKKDAAKAPVTKAKAPATDQPP